MVYFYWVSLAVVASDISRELKLTPQQLGSLSGILFYVYALARLPLGPMICTRAIVVIGATINTHY